MNTEIKCGQSLATQNIILGIIVVLMVGNMLDTIFTSQMLQIDGYLEFNPVADYIITNYNYETLMAFKMMPLIGLWIIRDNIRVSFLTTLYIAAFCFVLLNVYQIMMLMNPIIQ